jgi:hypothetical protein
MATNFVQGQRPIVDQSRDESEPVAEVYDHTGGLIIDEDPTIIPENALLSAENVEYFRNMLFRRNGLVNSPITKPNSTQIQDLFGYFETTTGLNLLRFTKNTVHKLDTASWINFPPSIIAANSGSINDYFSFAVIDNRCFFSNNGVDPIREIDVAGQLYKAVGNANKYRYITGAFNRIIGASRIDTLDIPYQVGWCGESNYTQWDPTVDLSAGTQNLLTSPTTLADDITGIFSTGELLLVPRQNSMWLGQHTPSATSPFSFFSYLPRLGADTPRTIKLTEHGLIWVSNQNSAVYVWIPGTPVYKEDDINIIHGKVARQFRSDLNNSLACWASYAPEAKMYSIYISYVTTSSTRVYNYSFVTKAWTNGWIDNGLSTVIDINYSNSALTINGLTGTINGLVGTIDQLGGLSQNSTRMYGFSNGNLLTQQFYSGLPSEINNIVVTDNGSSFTTTVGTKIYELPLEDTSISLLRFYLYPYSAGTVTLQYSKDDGNTWITLKSVTFTAQKQQKYIQLKRHRKSRRFSFRLQTTDCMCAFAGYVIRATKGGISNK